MRTTITDRKRGFVLFTVLGILAILSMLMVAISINAQSVSREAASILATRPFQALTKSGFDVSAAKILARDDTKPLQGAFAVTNASGSATGSFQNLGGRIDFNLAPFELLTALFRSEGMPESSSAEMAYRIIDWRDDNTQRESDGLPEAADYSATRNDQPKNAPFQTMLEAAQIPGMNTELLRSVSEKATVFSGKATVHIGLADPSVLIHVPGLAPATITALRNLIVSNDDQQSLLEIVSADPQLQALVDGQESASWRVQMTVTNRTGQTRQVSSTLAIIDNDTHPYRILSYEGPLEQVD